MLILKKPEANELNIIIKVHAECCQCGRETLLDATSTETAAIQLQRLGWHSFETDDVLGINACPQCIHELKQIEDAA
ncbi:MAG: hypothetical protein CENE_02629 [Candidatus Celerinatantimonas neptuna]|nr:MAG: hypothetical protein CENE_02629 [Candidatus Celerinatantimonas neptuna]